MYVAEELLVGYEAMFTWLSRDFMHGLWRHIDIFPKKNEFGIAPTHYFLTALIYELL